MLQSGCMPSHLCAFALGITGNIFLPIFAWKLLLILPSPNSDVFSLLWSLHISSTSLIRSVNFYRTLSLVVTCYEHRMVIPLLCKLWGTGTMPLSSLHCLKHHAHSGHLMSAERKAAWCNRAWELESEGQVVGLSSVTDEWCGQSEPNSASVKWA